MPPDFLHNHKDYKDLIRLVADENAITPDLVEKDYWIMHCLYGLQQQGYDFELKGGTSLSKGFNIIHRFSEDIDARIEPKSYEEVFIGKNQNKPHHVQSRKAYFDNLVTKITIPGISQVVRDTVFDNEKYRSGGIRLHYEEVSPVAAGIKAGILLELGFDEVTPNIPVDISSWALRLAQSKNVLVIDNTAKSVACYHPGYTFVEKLQTIATKFRQQQATGGMPKNFMRHYYDVACLLDCEDVTAFIGTDAYFMHKTKHFPEVDLATPLAENEGFLLNNPTTRALYKLNYESTRALYYKSQPAFDDVLLKIQSILPSL